MLSVGNTVLSRGPRMQAIEKAGDSLQPLASGWERACASTGVAVGPGTPRKPETKRTRAVRVLLIQAPFPVWRRLRVRARRIGERATLWSWPAACDLSAKTLGIQSCSHVMDHATALISSQACCGLFVHSAGFSVRIAAQEYGSSRPQSRHTV